MVVQYNNVSCNLSTLIRQKQEEFSGRVSIHGNLSKNNIRTIIDKNNIINVKVKDRNTGASLIGMPIKTNYHELSKTLISDKKGVIEFDLGSLNQRSTFQTNFSLDYEALINDLNDVENILKPNRM